ncbi:MAG: hypothetical protein ACRD1V_04765 [Vicinamibacterales bacterium]
MARRAGTSTKGARKIGRDGSRRPSGRAISRAELDRLTRLLGEQTAVLEKVRSEQDIQFRRMAQLQAEFDAIRQAWEKTKTVGAKYPFTVE